jgi:hypothetical protein
MKRLIIPALLIISGLLAGCCGAGADDPAAEGGVTKPLPGHSSSSYNGVLQDVVPLIYNGGQVGTVKLFNDGEELTASITVEEGKAILRTRLCVSSEKPSGDDPSDWPYIQDAADRFDASTAAGAGAPTGTGTVEGLEVDRMYVPDAFSLGMSMYAAQEDQVNEELSYTAQVPLGEVYVGGRLYVAASVQLSDPDLSEPIGGAWTWRTCCPTTSSSRPACTSAMIPRCRRTARTATGTW